MKFSELTDKDMKDRARGEEINLEKGAFIRLPNPFSKDTMKFRVLGGQWAFFSQVWFDVVTPNGRSVKIPVFATNVNPATGEIIGECPFVELSGQRQHIKAALNVLPYEAWVPAPPRPKISLFTKLWIKVKRLFGWKPKKEPKPKHITIRIGEDPDQTPVRVIQLPAHVLHALTEQLTMLRAGPTNAQVKVTSLNNIYPAYAVGVRLVEAQRQELEYPRWDIRSYYTISRTESDINKQLKFLREGMARKQKSEKVEDAMMDDDGDD
jgi:hypothetical protein